MKQGRTRIRSGVKLGHNGGVLDVAVSAWLVEFVRAQPRACHGAVRLDGVPLVQHALPVKLGEQPPNGLHVFGVVGHVRGFHVHPVAHLACERIPFRGVAHDGLSTGVVVLLHRQFGANVFFGDAQFLFHAEFDGKAVGVPSRFALNPMAFEGLEPAKNVLDGPCHHVVDARLAIGRWWPFKKDIRLVGRAAFYALLEGVLTVPNLEPLLCEGG